MALPYHQIALQGRPLFIDEADPPVESPPLASLRLGIAMLFAGMMLTLGVTLSLAAPDSARLATPAEEPHPVPRAESRAEAAGAS